MLTERQLDLYSFMSFGTAERNSNKHEKAYSISDAYSDFDSALGDGRASRRFGVGCG